MIIKNALSLFDGCSGLQQAFERSGITCENYFASEIDKHAIKVTMHNYPKTIQLGSVVDIDVSKLPIIDFLGGGSPCQSFSFAGKRKGMTTKDNIEVLTLAHYLELKNNNFEFEGQSYLFWEYIRILTEIRKTNPNVKFLLENVVMGEKWEKILTQAIGVHPILINSALVSAQNRRRLYWTNIGLQPNGLFGDLYSTIQQPKDKGILLRDILETDVPEKYYIKSENMLKFITDEWRQEKKYTQIDGDKSLPTMARMYTSWCGDYIKCVASRGRNPENPKSREAVLNTEQQLEPRTDGKTNCLTSVQKDNLVIQLNLSTESNGCQPYQQNRVYDTDGISPALMAQMSCGSHAILENKTSIRRLTPTECERLQTVKDNYTACVSDTQRYKMLGNGWNIDTIAHLLSYL